MTNNNSRDCMGYVNITNITFDKKIAPINQPFILQIQFETIRALKEEWKFVFVTNSDDSGKDQVLDRITMEETEFGVNEFCWEVDPPNLRLIEESDQVLDSSIIMIIVKYKGQKFFRCSYLIRQFYVDEQLNESPPEQIQWDKLYREIKTEKPIITVYDMVWDGTSMSSIPGNLSKEQFSGVNLLTGSDADEEDKRQRAEAIQQCANTISTEHSMKSSLVQEE